MIPDGVLSDTPVVAPFLEQVNRRSLPLIDFERGGVAIGDTSSGLRALLWTAEYTGGSVMLSSDTHPASVLFTRAGITQISLAFSQNMAPAIAFVDGDGSWLWWEDAALGGYTFVALPGATTPRICLDEKREPLLNTSDIILAYIKDNDLCYRQQRDRFLVEYVLAEDVDAELVAIGLNTANRLQFRMR